MRASTEENKRVKDQWLPERHRQQQSSASDYREQPLGNIGCTIYHCRMGSLLYVRIVGRDLGEQRKGLLHFAKSEKPFKRCVSPVIREQI